MNMAHGKDEDLDDYMSDTILSQCKDTRPGLIRGQAARVHKQEAAHKKKNKLNYSKPKKVLEAEKRTEGLGKAISSENKGFALLSKMGYKPGMAIGKSGEGRKDPVPIELKAGRSGLGRESELKRKQNEVQQMRAAMSIKRVRDDKRRQVDYQSQIRSRANDRKIESDLYKSQKVCEQLDSQQGLEKPAEMFFWPASMLPQTKKKSDIDEESGFYAYEETESDEEEEEEEEECNLTAAEMLEVLTVYLRSKHKYCVWCGTKYNDRKDLEDNCPGNTAAAHDE